MLGYWCRSDRLGRRLVLVLQGLPCTWGRCRFCPFALEQSVRLSEVIETNRRIIREALGALSECRATRVSVFNGSSFYELPVDTLVELRALTKGRVVDIESRPEYLTLERLRSTLELLGAKLLVVRVGFEVYDEKLRNEYLGKGIPQEELFRVSRLRLEARRRGLPVLVYSYLLFGIEGIPEDEVLRSLREFNRLFDGVIAVRYRRYLERHPREASVSQRLREALEREAVMVDWGEAEEWNIGEKE